jgi:hypothetical protein
MPTWYLNFACSLGQNFDLSFGFEKSVNHGDTKSLDLFDSEETPPPPTKKGNSMTKSSRSPKAAAATKKKQCEFFFYGIHLLLYLLLRLSSSMVGFTATPPVALFVAASASTMQLMSRHCLPVVLMAIPPMAGVEEAVW